MILKRVNISIVSAVLLFIFLLFMGGSSASSFIFVNNSEGPVADYTSIQQAVDNSVDEDFIVLYQGTYYENVDVDKKVTIMSESGNYSDTIVKAANESDHTFHISSDSVNIEGLSIEGAINCSWDDRIAGLFLESSNSCMISKNRFTGNYEGIILYDSHLNTLEMNNMFRNVNGNGISLNNSNDNMLNSNTIKKNWGAGILFSSSSKNEIVNNTLSANRDGIYLYRSSGNVLTYNNANSNHRYGIAFYTDSNENKLKNNSASFNKNSGIYLRSVNSNILSENVADSNYYNGIFMRYSDENQLMNNSVSENMPDTSFDDKRKPAFGIYMTNSDLNDIIGNQIFHNKDSGIGIQESDDNSINGNFLVSSSNGIRIIYSSNNLIYNNYFHNLINVAFEGNNFGNLWNTDLHEEKNIVNGDFVGGNFWSEPYRTGYSQDCEDIDDNGICDIPYLITGMDSDMFPLYESTCSYKGDFDRDSDVDFIDFVKFAASYNSMIDDSKYCVIFDFENDCDVDFIDFVQFAENYQK